MENNYINFRKQRELGDLISVTFQFVRENYKPLFKYLYKFSGPAFLLMAAAIAYYSSSVTVSPVQILEETERNVLIPLLALFGAVLIFYSALYATVMHYIRSYIQNRGTVEESEIREGFYGDFGKIILLFILIGLIVFAGLMFFIIPGIYLMVPLSLAPAVLVFDRFKINETISHCFQLIKDHWWMTFFTLLVIWLLVYIISLVFQLPVLIYTFVKVFTHVQEGAAADPESYSDWVFITLNVLASLVQYVLSFISVIGVTFIYFNLNEHKNLTGTYEAIDNIGE